MDKSAKQRLPPNKQSSIGFGQRSTNFSTKATTPITNSTLLSNILHSSQKAQTLQQKRRLIISAKKSQIRLITPKPQVFKKWILILIGRDRSILQDSRSRQISTSKYTFINVKRQKRIFECYKKYRNYTQCEKCIIGY